MKLRTATAAALVAATVCLTGCSTPADVASHNLSQEAEQFKVNRRIAGINLITDKYLFVAEGKCSIERMVGEVEITCKVGPDAYQKHFVEFPEGANIMVTVEQQETVDVSDYSYTFMFRPETLLPTIVRP